MFKLLKLLSFLLGHLPVRVVRPLGAIFGALAYRLSGRHRKVALSNLERALGGAEGERKRIARGVFRNLATMFFEFTRLPWLDRGDIEKMVEFSGLENFDRALSRGRGVILLTAHFGNWELLAAALGHRGYSLDIVVRKIDNPAFERFVTWARSSSGNRMIYKRRAMRKLLKALASNAIVTILVDQNVAASEGVFVDFFGVPACTNKGPAHLAQASGAAVVPAFICRKGRGHVLEVMEELSLSNTGDRERDAIENTTRFTRVVEEMIRKHPQEWFWVHRRWKTRPAGE
ncbi:MAG TPA: lipid A biosynthesis acyltransferase [Deltaproteobacteria bacterium]|nr:MAG: hypothetical protein A2Z79_00805 [Deltaproteobacteria bacterium GWA2_55_82]OGQ64274.1 MAG: hypothetical protein A3I81_13120 [Deltaproteobacteria bacterium RIFCSPLOWO2_02_FULL_55_12]OIJ73983.1 MAG: hypothetical protein A2V21_306715 [Deltaproteobacteria bacterium GWC2_55_46]HBG46583.1 lipid A biosynthesis acyltransferase [Deltaproteobacteria bacterium]HCY09985.1 lipid A biosynthesis acyltransferase [Deltaproteobacteria bacterium]